MQDQCQKICQSVSQRICKRYQLSCLMAHILQNAYRTTSKNLCAFCPDRCHYQVCPSHVTLHVRTLNWSEISKADVGMHDVRSWVEHLCQNDIRMCVSYIIEFFVFRTKTTVPSVVGRNHIGRMSASLHELSLLSEMDCQNWLEHLWFQVMGCCQNKDMFQLSTVVVLTGVLERINWIGCLSK